MTLDYERINHELMSKAIGTSNDEFVITRGAFRWSKDGQFIPNAFEIFCVETVCEDNNWEIVAKYGNHIAVCKECNK